MKSTYTVSSIGKFAGQAFGWLRYFAIACLAIGAVAASAATISSIKFVSNGGRYVNDTILDGGTSPLGITSTRDLNQPFLNASDSTAALSYGSYYGIAFRTFGAHVGAGTISFLLNGITPYSKVVTFPDPTAVSGVFVSFALPDGDVVSISSTGLSSDRIRIVADGGGFVTDGTPDAFYLVTFTSGTPETSTYNVATDFSLASNPNGAWSYGYKTSSTAALQLFDTASTNFVGFMGLELRYTAALSSEPHVLHNQTNATVKFRNTVTIGAKEFQLHPAPGKLAVVRWTSPVAGTFKVDAAFKGNDSTSTLVKIQQNGTAIFDGAVNKFGPGPTFSGVITFAINDVLEFLVDANGLHQNDSTGLAVTITNTSSSKIDPFCQTGSAINPNSAYSVDVTNGTVTDTRSNLMWDQCAYGLSGATCSSGTRLGYGYDTAKAVASGLGNYKGRTGWRLPTILELKSLVETCRTGPAINTDAFPNTIDSAADAITTFWSSDVASTNTTFAKSLSFSDGGEINLPKKSSFQFRLVRSTVVVPPVSVTVTASGGANGTITPLGPQTVATNATVTYTVNASAGHTAAVGGTCGGTLSGSSYTTNPVTANCTVVASFGTDIDPVCQSVGVWIKSISRVNLDESMNAARAKVVGYGGLKQTYNVTCSNGRFGVVRTPGSLIPGGETYALVQRPASCVRQDVKIPGPAVTSKTDIDDAILASGDGKSDATEALKANKLIGPLAAEICL